jgi:hypothetical protein
MKTPIKSIDIQPLKKETLVQLSRRAVNQANLNCCVVNILFADSVTAIPPQSDYIEVMKNLKVKELKLEIVRAKMRLANLKAQ